MRIEFNNAEVALVSRGLVMLEKSLARKAKQDDLSNEMKALVTRELVDTQGLYNKVITTEVQQREVKK